MRPRRDIDDLDESLFDRDEAQRRREQRAEMIAAGEERLRQEAALDAAAAARAREFMVESTKRAILAEYERAGVSPRPGFLVSLPLLLSMGWRIEEAPDGERVLVAPPTPQKWEGHTDADSLDGTKPRRRGR